MFNKKSDAPICRYFQTPCKKHKCVHYIDLPVTDKEGKVTTHFQCADIWQLKLSLEASQKLHELGAAIESFRNEMVEQNKQAAAIFRERNIDTARSSEQLCNDGPAAAKYYYQDN